MSFKIIVDSCCELPQSFVKSTNTEIVPLALDVDDYHIIDDENFNQKEFLKKVAESPNCPRSSCPSPERYLEAMKADCDHIYVITLSAELSGSYNSAVLAKNLYHEEIGEKDIYIFDSRSASCGETQIAFWIKELEEKSLSFQELTEQIEKKIDNRKTYFVLETLETLRKNGRLSGIKAFVASTLNIKPIMAGTKQGSIVQLGQARGTSKALAKMVEISLKEVEHPEEKTLMITDCNCPERAKDVLNLYLTKAKFKDTLVMEMRGLSSLYACDGGIIVTI